MLGALATLLFFAVTPVFAHRAAELLGSLRANLARLAVAAIVLGAWAHVAGGGLGGAAVGWFALGGVVGFGLGGVAMFQSLPRLGSNLSTLIVQCGSAVAAAAVEWAWLGARLSLLQAACFGATLVGVTVGLMTADEAPRAGRRWRSGVAWAVLSAVGQGVGAVISRKAFAVTASAGLTLDPGTAAYQRVLGGLMVAWLVHLAFGRRVRAVGGLTVAAPWVAANALTGPILGVTCYQWALRAFPAGIVQPIVAAAPLLTLPFAAWLEGTRPRPWYYPAAVLAVAGVAGLMTWK